MTLTDFKTARSLSGGITSDFSCYASLVTNAGEPGSLEKQNECGAIEYEETHPHLWDIPVPISMTPSNTILTECDFNACKVNMKKLCHDDPSFKFKKNRSSKKKTKCAYLTQGLHPKKRTDKFCNKWNVKKHCRLSCDNC